jgi:hypothetical protein
MAVQTVALLVADWAATLGSRSVDWTAVSTVVNWAAGSAAQWGHRTVVQTALRSAARTAGVKVVQMAAHLADL